MCRVLIMLAMLVYSSYIMSQPLLANGSLNERNTCTEFHALCAPEAWFFIPTYIKTSQQKEPGDYFEELSMGTMENSPRLRNYIYTKLLCPLIVGKQYKYSIWINTGGNDFDHLDIYLSTEEPGQKRSVSYINHPTFTLTPTNEDSSLKGWTKYSFVFTANGGERFLMAGNLSAAGMDLSKIKILTAKHTVLYAIDNILLTAVDNTIKVCPEYAAVLKQVYDQNRRHPSGFIEDVELDTALITKFPFHKKEITWVIVDTPPSLKKPFTDTLIIPDVLFLSNSSKLNNAFIKTLNSILEKLKTRTFKGLEIIGNTDNKGSPNYNLQLSKERATTIKDYIVAKLKLNAETVITKGMGETAPVANNNTTEGRQKNRRVEIVLKD